jgi:hypothetical protein
MSYLEGTAANKASPETGEDKRHDEPDGMESHGELLLLSTRWHDGLPTLRVHGAPRRHHRRMLPLGARAEMRRLPTRLACQRGACIFLHPR